MAQVKNLHLNDDVALAGHTHTAGDITYGSSETYGDGTVGAKLNDVSEDIAALDYGKVSVINSDDSIAVDTSVHGTTTSPKISVNISAESDNGLQLKTTGNKGLYVSKETLGLSSVYIPQGNIDISGATGSTDAEKQKNAAAALLADTTNVQLGFVYNIPYDGTIAESAASGAPDITVKVGDNIAVVEVGGVRKWDKLSATIDVPVYTGGDGIAIDSSTHVVSVDLVKSSGNDASGLTINSGKLKVKTGSGVELDTATGHEGELKVDPSDGITLDSNGVKVNLSSTNPGLALSGTAGSKTLQVDPGDGIAVDSNGVKVNISSSNPGLALAGSTAGSKTLQVDPGDGITVDSNGVKVNISSTDPGLELSGNTAGSKTLQVLVKSSDPGLSKTDGLHVGAGEGIATSGTAVKLNRKTSTDASQQVTQVSGLAIDGNGAVSVNAGNGIEISGNVVGVDISDTTGKKNINNNDGTYVSLDRAFSITGTAKLDDSAHNPTIGTILAALGATMS